MRAARIIFVSGVVLALCLSAYWVFGRGTNMCSAFETDLEHAIGDPGKAPGDHRPVGWGGCTVTKTTTFDVHVFGAGTHKEQAIRGRLYVGGAYTGNDPARGLRSTKVALKDDPTNRIVLAPELGRGAFLVIARPTAAADALAAAGQQTVMSPLDAPNPALLPVTAHWRRGTTLYSASAARAGASLDETQRETLRVAQFVTRRPIKSLDP